MDCDGNPRMLSLKDALFLAVFNPDFLFSNASCGPVALTKSRVAGIRYRPFLMNKETMASALAVYKAISANTHLRRGLISSRSIDASERSVALDDSRALACKDALLSSHYSHIRCVISDHKLTDDDYVTLKRDYLQRLNYYKGVLEAHLVVIQAQTDGAPLVQMKKIQPQLALTG